MRHLLEDTLAFIAMGTLVVTAALTLVAFS
jgi:hypothetical protein